VQVIASHYLEAYLADPTAPDAEAIRTDARDFLTRAGERAGSLAAQHEAERYFLRAAELTDDEAVRADLLLRAGRASAQAGHVSRAEPGLRDALAAFREVGDAVGEARATMELALLLWRARHIDEAVTLLEGARAVLPADAPAALRAELAATTGRLLFFHGRLDDALSALEEALELAEAERMLAVLSDALNTKALVLQARNRPAEARALLDGALAAGQDSGVTATQLRAYANLSYTCGETDTFDDGVAFARAGVELARRVGDRSSEWFLQGNEAAGYAWVGEWDEALRICEQAIDGMAGEAPELVLSSLLGTQLVVWTGRGEVDHVDPAWMEARFDTSDVQERGTARTQLALLLAAKGEHESACELAGRVIAEDAAVVGLRHPMLRWAFPLVVDSALACGRLEEAVAHVEHLEQVPLGHLSPFLVAALRVARARVDDARGLTEGVEEGLRAGVRILAERRLAHFRAQAQGYLAEWLARQGRRAEAEQVAAEALETFERLRATPWVDRLAPLRTQTASA
jgi:tetratricopeptide (TPR) repeat protein